MKKVLKFVTTSIYILTLMILSVFMFWELYAKDYLVDHIETVYGYKIIQTFNNSELLIEYNGLKKDIDDS